MPLEHERGGSSATASVVKGYSLFAIPAQRDQWNVADCCCACFQMDGHFRNQLYSDHFQRSAALFDAQHRTSTKVALMLKLRNRAKTRMASGSRGQALAWLGRLEVNRSSSYWLQPLGVAPGLASRLARRPREYEVLHTPEELK